MRDDCFKGGSFTRNDRRLLRACRTGDDRDVQAAAQYTLSAEFVRQVGDCPKRIAPLLVGEQWMIEAALDTAIDSEASPGGRKFIELVQAGILSDQPVASAVEWATQQMLRDDAEARANKLRHHAETSEGPGSKAAQGQARHAADALRAASIDSGVCARLVSGEAPARPKKRPVSPDEVIAS